jgi:multiple sugar transport system permease protein
MFLIFTSGLLSLPKDTYEAADIDGASSWMKFRYLTLRYMKPLIGIAVILRFMDAMKLFDTIYILTGGGPSVATETLMYYTYRVSYIWWNLGYGAALSLFLYLVIIITCEIFYNMTTRRD